MPHKILLITPPFTQMNTPYPATAYLKGFFNEQGISSCHTDLGIEVIHKIFCREGLTAIFDRVSALPETDSSTKRMLQLSNYYMDTIEPVIRFLENKNPTLARAICNGNFLPESNRFAQIADLEWAFGNMGFQDKARHLCTLYLEDISDLIINNIDKNFGFSRYAEHLGMAAHSFTPIQEALAEAPTLIEAWLAECLENHIQSCHPAVVGISVPFPGNLLGAFRAAQWVKQHHPGIVTVMGGGYPNTELRNLNEPRVFDYFDYITLDDGEAAWYVLLQHLENNTQIFKRTFRRVAGKVVYENNSTLRDFKQSETGTPDYRDLPLDKYLSVIEMANPMHSLWSDGRWNKLTLAHGCYWGKCTFCDISLDYIKIYEATSARQIADRMETIIAQTGQTGFHFVDEAAPPAMMRELALEILRRGLKVSWWTNIRFEKSFTYDLCMLLAASGLIAVSGGLEVASDRLLALINKGVTVAQVAQVADHFTRNGIMVHAYLMYGFPTETAQETIDSLENVRQLFDQGVIQSGFWHRFAMTEHSPVGMNPGFFNVERLTEQQGLFANNDVNFRDSRGADHEVFTGGLNKSLFNFMHGIGFDFPLQEWFDFDIPIPTIPPSFIENALKEKSGKTLKPTDKILWLNAGSPSIYSRHKKKKGRHTEEYGLQIITINETIKIGMPHETACWLQEILPQISPAAPVPKNMKWLEEQYPENTDTPFEAFLQSAAFKQLRASGFLVL